MWNPTKTTATSSTETSDNKNKENIEDCSCSSGSKIEKDICRNSSCNQKHQDQQQQQLNNFENNSKNQKTIFGGGDLTKRSSSSIEEVPDFLNKLQDKEEALGGGTEATDSGFISGPQDSSSQIYDRSEEFIDEQEGATGYCSSSSSNTKITKYNILPKEQKHQQQQQQQQQAQNRKQESAILDSGCIDDEIDEEENSDNADLIEREVINQNQQVRLELSNTSRPAVATATSQNSNTNTVKNNEQMILKHNADAGMSEWFCKLSLQSDSTNTTGTSSRPSQVAGLGMNDLNISNNDRKSSVASENQSQRTPQQSPAAPHPNPGQSITLTNAWEQFYQQNDDGDTPLHIAVIFGVVDVVAALLRMAPHPCLFNIQNDCAQTPLHLAALTSQPKIIRMLLLAGAEPTIRDRDGNTALHLACKSGEIQCVRTLLEKFTASEIVEAHRQFGHLSTDKSISSLNFARLPSDLEIRNYDGERCVHLVARNGNIDILRLLVLHGADINAREGRSGLTPLHIAIECCNEKLANFLLDKCEKLNVETATYAGLTAYQVACMLNKSQLQAMLENYGAEPLTPPDSDYDSSDIEDLDDSKYYEYFGDPGYFIGYGGGNPMTVA